jgi:hypothetical protein
MDCLICRTAFTPSHPTFDIVCSRACGDAHATEAPRVMGFREVQRRLASLNLEGARPAAAADQASLRRADARSVR